MFTKLRKYVTILSGGEKMNTQLIFDINQYISYLNNSGLSVTVQGKDIDGLFENNIHRNPFCSLVKTDEAAWQECIHCQHKVLKEHKRESLFGMCYAGVEEYVFFVNDKAFISVSGYGIDKERAARRITRLCQNYNVNKKALLNVYENNLKHKEEDLEQLTTLIKPLCHMLNLLLLTHLRNPEVSQTKETLLNAMLNHIQYTFTWDLTVDQIAKVCACSVSTACHVFKKYTGESIKQYINKLRINQAKQLLSTTNLSINQIAQSCGFSNINYFPTAFKKHTGVTPTAFRAEGGNV
jgi:YesN/AraC family two-component response regulator